MKFVSCDVEGCSVTHQSEDGPFGNVVPYGWRTLQTVPEGLSVSVSFVQPSKHICPAHDIGLKFKAPPLIVASPVPGGAEYKPPEWVAEVLQETSCKRCGAVSPTTDLCRLSDTTDGAHEMVARSRSTVPAEPEST